MNKEDKSLTPAHKFNVGDTVYIIDGSLPSKGIFIAEGNVSAVCYVWNGEEATLGGYKITNTDDKRVVKTSAVFATFEEAVEQAKKDFVELKKLENTESLEKLLKKLVEVIDDDK